MRHSRRAVMAEQYKLYMRKNFFNGRYFVRNVQFVVGIIITFAVLFGAIALIKDKNSSTNVADKSNIIDVKEALFGNSDLVENELTSNDNADNKNIADGNEYKEEVENLTEEEAGSSAIVETSKAVEVISELSAVSYDNTDVDVQDAADDIGDIASSAVGKSSVSDSQTDKSEETSATAETDEGEFADRCIANVDETLNIRKEPSPDAEFVGLMERGSIAKVVDTEGDWTKIKSGDVEGYVLSEFILTGKVAEAYAKNYVTIQGTALEDGINIREDRSTDADILKVLEKDDKVSIVEDLDESTDKAKKESDKSDNITWVTVMLDDGQIGYVSKDYVEIDKLYTLAVSAEELQRREAERLAAERAAEEAAMLAQQQASSSSSNGSTSYQGAKTTPVTATASGESLGTFYITAYCGCEQCSGGHNKTASGTTPTEGRTIAADTSILPFGTQVVIDGVVYTVEDRGSGVSGNHIDIFFATHEDALAFGSKSVTVYKY